MLSVKLEFSKVWICLGDRFWGAHAWFKNGVEWFFVHLLGIWGVFGRRDSVLAFFVIIWILFWGFSS